MSKHVYVVYRHGVYGQGISGVADTHEDAIKICEQAKSLEPDDYHEFRIIVCKLNDVVTSLKDYNEDCQVLFRKECYQ